MSENYWRGPFAYFAFSILLAVIGGVLLWDFSAYSTEQRVRYEQASSSQSQQATERIEAECGSDLSGIEYRSCVEQIVEAQEDHKRAERDLDAQEQMARFTRVMGWASLIGLVLGVGSIGLIWATLLETQRLTLETRHIGQAQTRAYVEVAGVKFYWGTPEGDRPQLKIVLTNYGNTPAKWFQVRQNYSVFEHAKGNAIPNRFEDLPLLDEFGPVWNGINPDESGMQTQGPEITGEAIKNCWRDRPRAKGVPSDNTHGILVFGEIRYCTIFNEIFRSQFLFGAGTLECFEVEGSVEHERYQEGPITYTATTRFEKPHFLTRLPIRLALYEHERN